MSVHSNWLWGGVEGGGPNLRYTVPAGVRTVIKCVSGHNTFAGFNRLYVELYNGATVEGYIILPLDAPGTQEEAKTINCFHVLRPGWTIKTDALHANINVLLSGAELLL